MDEPGGLRLKRRLRCGRGGRLLEWDPRTSSREERDACEMQDESESHVSPTCLSCAARIPIDQ
jgi:hypothetical protein